MHANNIIVGRSVARSLGRSVARSLSLMALFAVSILLSPLTALADGEPMRASMVTHEAFGWQFAPVIAQHQVRGFVGWNITNESVGNKFTLT